MSESFMLTLKLKKCLQLDEWKLQSSVLILELSTVHIGGISRCLLTCGKMYKLGNS